MTQTIQGYIATAPKESRGGLRKIKNLIKEIAPQAEGSISYGMPGYKLYGRPLVYFAAWKSHIGFYALPSGHEKFKHRLKGYEGAKGSVRFPLDKPLPLALIRSMIRFRASENKTKIKKASIKRK